MEEAKDHNIYIPVKCYFPRAGALKLNFDRFAKSNPDPSGGGVIRDNNGSRIPFKNSSRLDSQHKYTFYGVSRVQSKE
ncbi:hypothetical protein KY285_010417 [Solanum tuberosum]|nr:hypothetical protein KY289_010966 [Solanum tuberosum]KAH0734710.1 hypothetical protein KY285_010417 [Solanum tuberosum]